MDRARAESRLKRYFAGRDDVVVAYLFGSVARDTARDDSDVDVAVLLATMPEDPYERSGSDIVAELTSRLGVDVDVVVLNHAPVDLIHRVLRDGRIVAEPDRSRRIAFEVDARNRYFDVKERRFTEHTLQIAIQACLDDFDAFVEAVRVRLSPAGDGGSTP